MQGCVQALKGVCADLRVLVIAMSFDVGMFIFAEVSKFMHCANYVRVRFTDY